MQKIYKNGKDYLEFLKKEKKIKEYYIVKLKKDSLKKLQMYN